MWRGPALAGLADLGFARVEATRLDQARLGAVEGLAEAELARCRHRGRVRRNCASAGTVEVAPEAQFAGTRRSSPPGQVPL
ncbi:MAG: BTAD domain-containing putative transcriptional regulator [Acidimicrobiia bacterium]